MSSGVYPTDSYPSTTEISNPETTEITPSSDKTWPGDWDPGRLDATRAHEIPKRSFVETFRHALAAADANLLNAVDFFDDDAELPLQYENSGKTKVRLSLLSCVSGRQ